MLNNHTHIHVYSQR